MDTTPPLASSERTLGTLLGTVRSELVRAMEAELVAAGVDLRFTPFLILKRLGQQGPMSASELARAVDLDGGAMTRQLDQLEGKGFLCRRPHEQDRRTLRIELTSAGVDVVKHLIDCSARVLGAAQRSLNASEQAQLHDYLERVLSALRNKP
ncbi:MAG: MarR family transcriptional regulator [Rhodanobacter sp.]